MSVVEKAIRKLREAKRAAGEASPPGLEQVPDAPATRAPSVPREHGATVLVERGALRAAGLLPPEEEMDMLARQYRKIKHPLVAHAVGRGVPRLPKGYLIMIASAVAGEGKSFTALNLALSLALEKDLRVLLVDADVAKPQLTKELGLERAPGLLDALRDLALDVESLIHPTDVPTLSFLPAGVGAGDATELLASARMERLAVQLGQNDAQRIVVFDSPPLLQTTESTALAHVAGQIVVVVRAESTSQPVLLDALKALDGHPAVSLVLNQSVRAAGSEYYYGYGGAGPGAGSA